MYFYSTDGIAIRDFPTHVARLHSENNIYFIEEYEVLHIDNLEAVFIKQVYRIFTGYSVHMDITVLS